jgi:adenylyltransferase/sulfurtransferase
VQDRQFTPDQLNRYSRHFLLPEVGEEGQAKLLDAKVLLIGAGGLGSPSAFYLAAAGVGTLGLIDNDVVDTSNLQRQILHTNDRVGMPKVESARLTLNALNPDVKVIGYQERISSENILDLIRDYDVIVDGCDNFPTRYLVNDACVMTGKPNVHGSIFQFEGQASVFYPGRGPCYGCLFPEPPPPGAAPSCQEAGVLGVLPGLVGCVQALETIKLILGKGKPLIGRMVYFDTLSMELRIHKLRKDPACPVCGPNPTVTSLIDYEEFCGLRSGGEAAGAHA